MRRTITVVFFWIIILTGVQAQVLDKSWEGLVIGSGAEWYSSPQAHQVAENVLLYQRDIGGWPKNTRMQDPLTAAQKEELVKLKSTPRECTTDNGATILEMIYLSKCYEYKKDPRYVSAFLAGIDYLLEAQYDNGGWPQFYPLREGYYSHITYNDGSMVNILSLFKELLDGTGFYSIPVPEFKLREMRIAFNKGIDCILKTQYRQNGILTSWCAQHDVNTLAPAKARSYELPSLSGAESAGIVLLLMSIDNPSPEVINSVKAAVEWFEKVKITGVREVKTYNAKGKIIDKKLITDESAPPLWARFMDLETNEPFFCDRDGIKKSTMDQIGAERRNGYAWYKTDPMSVLAAYPGWLAKIETPDKKPVDEYNMTVALDGSGDYTSLQQAIDNAKSFPAKDVIINIKNGIYHEKVRVYEWNTRIHLVGESRDSTIIRYDDYFDKINRGRNSTFHTYTVLVEGDDFYATNLTIENSAGEVGQAVALSVIADRVHIDNCRILGNQDTIYASGLNRQYFSNCYIDGTTDFIFGGATVLFENCRVHSKKNSYITAASTPQNGTFGLVFLNCKLTADPDIDEVYLGRPWRDFAKTVFMNCTLGEHILPEGWHNWNKPNAEKTAFYAEFDNDGPGFKPKSRVPWSYQLKKSQARQYTRDKILGTDENGAPWYLK